MGWWGASRRIAAGQPSALVRMRTACLVLCPAVLTLLADQLVMRVALIAGLLGKLLSAPLESAAPHLCLLKVGTAFAVVPVIRIPWRDQIELDVLDVQQRCPLTELAALRPSTPVPG